MMNDSDKTLIFLHIPKAGGSTLTRIIAQNYPGESRFLIVPDSEFSPENFRKFPDEQKRKYRAVTGHCVFGIHKYIPQPTTYITMLRDPVARVISNFHHVRRTPEHPLHQKVNSAKMTLEDYVTSGINPQLDNGQVRQLSGVEISSEFGNCTSEMLTEAQENLVQFFSVTALMEKFDESLILLQQSFGWKNISYQKLNVSPTSPPEAMSPESLKKIKECNLFDIELYRFAAQRFEALWHQHQTEINPAQK
ncbi:MAG: sulfotransferase family 2 domain-containing protein [Verrucomicrobiota bacterium]|nr:sulfotransferase family 2 domain-containing protein [Verrucomicrobiota bacterium]